MFLIYFFPHIVAPTPISKQGYDLSKLESESTLREYSCISIQIIKTNCYLSPLARVTDHEMNKLKNPLPSDVLSQVLITVTNCI